MITNNALINTFNYFFELINWLIIIRVILSLLRLENMSNPISKIIIILTEPILEPFRKLQFRSSLGRNMMLDFSPILAILVIQYLVRPIIITIILRIMG